MASHGFLLRLVNKSAMSQGRLNPAVHCHTVTAPLDLGTCGKWADCDLLMEYAKPKS